MDDNLLFTLLIYAFLNSSNSSCDNTPKSNNCFASAKVWASVDVEDVGAGCDCTANSDTIAGADVVVIERE